MELLNRLKTLKKAWEVTKTLDLVKPKLDGDKELSMEEIKDILNDVPLGDGKAEFLGEGTHDEYKDFVNESKGLKGIFGL